MINHLLNIFKKARRLNFSLSQKKYVSNPLRPKVNIILAINIISGQISQAIQNLSASMITKNSWPVKFENNSDIFDKKKNFILFSSILTSRSELEILSILRKILYNQNNRTQNLFIRIISVYSRERQRVLSSYYLI